jgi:hypothetical protein
MDPERVVERVVAAAGRPSAELHDHSSHSVMWLDAHHSARPGPHRLPEATGRVARSSIGSYSNGPVSSNVGRSFDNDEPMEHDWIQSSSVRRMGSLLTWRTAVPDRQHRDAMRRKPNSLPNLNTSTGRMFWQSQRQVPKTALDTVCILSGNAGGNPRRQVLPVSNWVWLLHVWAGRGKTRVTWH